MAPELNPVSIYSAVVSTGVAGWQIYTYFRDGARLRASSGGNRKLAGGGCIDPETYFVVNAVNVGNRATTIQSVGLYTYASWWRRLRRKPSDAFVVMMSAGPGNTVPHVLEPGHTFMGLGIQTVELVKLSNEKLLYIAVAHSMAKRDILIRLEPIEAAKQWSVPGQGKEG